MRHEAERDARLLALIATGTRGEAQQVERLMQQLADASIGTSKR